MNKTKTKKKPIDEKLYTALAGEKSLAKDWNSEEEEKKSNASEL